MPPQTSASDEFLNDVRDELKERISPDMFQRPSS
jgi:hypothetical protein